MLAQREFFRKRQRLVSAQNCLSIGIMPHKSAEKKREAETARNARLDARNAAYLAVLENPESTLSEKEAAREAQAAMPQSHKMREAKRKTLNQVGVQARRKVRKMKKVVSKRGGTKEERMALEVAIEEEKVSNKGCSVLWCRLMCERTDFFCGVLWCRRRRCPNIFRGK